MPEPRTRTTLARLTVLSIVGLVLGTYAWWPMLFLAPNTPELDGRYAYQLILIGKATFQNFGEWPMWNPYDCKGIPLWDHPENMTASPLLILLTPLSAMTTYYLWNLLHMAAGWVSAWLLLRDEYRFSRLATFAGACMWTFGCCHTTQYCGAHEGFVAFWLFPLQLLLWRRAETSDSAAIGLGLLVAFFVYEGATYPLPMVIVVLAFESMFRLWPPRRLLRIVRAGSIVGTVGIMMSAARLLPLLDQLALYKRPIHDQDSMARWTTIGSMWTHHEPNWLAGLIGQQYVWGEYLSYIGLASLVIAIIGLFIASNRDWRLIALASIVFTCMLGHFHRYSPWSLLNHHVPIFTSIRVASRFRILFHMFVAIFFAYAVEYGPKWGERRFGRGTLGQVIRIGIVGLAFIGIGDMIGFGFDLVKTRFRGPPPPVVTTVDHFYYGGPEISADYADAVRQNRGWMGCRSYEWPSRHEAAVWTGDVVQARATDDGAQIVSASRTSSTFTVDVDAKRSTMILLDSGYAPGWQTNIGVITESKGMLALQLPQGYHKVRMKYWPRRMNMGIGLTAAGTFGLLVLAVVKVIRRRRRR